MDDHDELVRLYGPWSPRTPDDAVELLEGYRGTWWVAGGWAIEAFTARPRPHGDLDLSLPRRDAAAFQTWVRGRLDTWAADDGTLRPLIAELGLEVPARCENLWLRRSGADPWDYDVILMDVSEGEWIYKRDPRVRRPLDQILWLSNGVQYLRPEVQLLHKAAGLRAKDEDDFDACSPTLDVAARSWLIDALRTAHPEHAWIERLVRAPSGSESASSAR